ncbi:retrotransposon hot spot (RHS) protein [Trypanosoma conorhini]|uniref:Retrotransposon hot spot (RHS) protein n=1 Tax=Trypanosoma conorhini TaxID=83891 RepID=A0A3R7KUU3_9TRYP|nr:retrotransposon hot spot (RHS) protein [Trypanosoma conorhini]RNF01818.1 retrotransposon hot spot (RHS) protein [Trypanosoma conorhini]
MCSWETRHQPAQAQADYWETVEQRMERVGPFPRYVLSEAAFNGRTEAVESALQAIDASVAKDYFAREAEIFWCEENPFKKFVKVERECGKYGHEIVKLSTISDYADQQMVDRLCEVLGDGGALSLLSGAPGAA